MKRFAALRAAVMVAGVVVIADGAARGQAVVPLTYEVTVPSPDSHVAQIRVTVPAGAVAGGAVELMMPVWTPGYYRVEDYAAKVQELKATGADGAALVVEKPAKNRWRATTGAAGPITVTYGLLGEGRSVTGTWVAPDMGVFNGGSAFVTLVEKARRPHIVRLQLPPVWKAAASSLETLPGDPNSFVSPDYDTLVDSPIVAGNLAIQAFEVEGSVHQWVDVGERGEWDGAAAAAKVEKIVRANHVFWGGLPFKKYVFLNVFRRGAGGLEHLNSTLLTSSPPRAATASAPATAPGRGGGGGAAAGSLAWLNFVSHEYFHAFNVKRLRPIELGPFDYEKPAATTSLWISEGLTVYYGELMVCRGGLATETDYLAAQSGHIRSLQAGAGRLKQTLNQSSLAVWDQSTSGIGGNPETTVSYYGKGTVVGFLLDAHIRKVTDGKKSLDDVMRLAMTRYSGARGFKAEEFVAVAEEVSVVDMKGWFHRALETTEELEYGEMLEFYGVRFAEGTDPRRAYTLEVRPDASDAQKARLRAVVTGK